MVALKSILVLFFVGLVVAEEAVQAAAPVESRKISKPSCHHNHLTVSCCLGISVKGHPLNTCVELAFISNQMKAVATLKVNDRNIVSKDAAVGQLCAPLPAPLSMVKACLHVYYADVSLKNKSADVCFVVEIKHIAQVKFDCFRLRGGKFDHHSEHPPEKHGFMQIGWKHGHPTFHLGSHK